MNDDDKGMNKADQLRHRAEEVACGQSVPSPADLKTMSPEETQRALHELHVHQIELKMQNDELLRVQVELDAMRARYFDLYNLAPVGYFVVSLEGLIMEVNLAAATLLNLPRAALIKKPISRFVHKEDQDVYYLHRRQLLRTGKPHECELRMVKDDGTEFWALLTATAAQDPPTSANQGGEDATVHHVVLSDITARKQVEEEKAALESKYKESQKRHSDALKIEHGKSKRKPVGK